MRVEVIACDIDPESGLPAQQYTITQGDRKVTLDLCGVHGEPLEELLLRSTARSVAPAPVRAAKRVPPAKVPQVQPRRGRAPGGRKIQVKTVAEIEAEKKRNR